MSVFRPLIVISTIVRRRSMTWCVAQRFCDVSDVCLRPKSPFRPSATDFEGSKSAKSPLRFRPDFVGFLRPDTYVALCVVSAIAVKKRFYLCAVTTSKACRCVAAQISHLDAERHARESVGLGQSLRFTPNPESPRRCRAAFATCLLRRATGSRPCAG
ncbi:hypothetical protein ALQ34_103155 [Pseudomonas syringae pv. maculicola]|nr:hypothetical protein ALQ34_103155 [Pseudomonas syringae pv. maculicola]